MTDFLPFNATSHQIVLLEADYNNLLDHGLEKAASYIIRKNGSYYEAIKGGTSSGAGTIAFGGADNAGATDGTDSSAVFNATIAALTSGGKIFIKQAVYSCTDPIIGANGVVLEGETMGPFEDLTTIGTILDYTGAADTAFLNFNACRWFALKNLKLYNSGGNTISGLFLGDTTNSANKSKGITVDSVAIDNFDYGIEGNTWGPDDSEFRNVWISNCDTACIDNLSSMCRFYGGSLQSSPIGVKIRRAAGTSADAGMQFFGTVFSGCDIPIEIDGEQSINTLSFFNCWFEDVDTMILRTTSATAAINCGSVLFDNCVASINIGSSTTWMDLSGRTIRVEINGGSWVTTGDIAEGACDAGSDATHTVDAAILVQADDYWNSYYIRYLSGARAGERALISDFDQGTNTATHAALTGAPAAGDHYVIGGARIICDGTGSTNQFLRVTDIVGQNHVYFTDTSSGLSGFTRTIIPLIDDINTFQPGAPLNVTYTGVGHDHDLPFRKYEVVKATAAYRWNPGSAGGKQRLYFDSAGFGASEPGAAGVRVDAVDCSDFVRFKCGNWGDVATQAADDNATAPTFYYTWLVIEH